MRFHGDPEPEKLVWSMPVKGAGFDAIKAAIAETIKAYRWTGGVPASDAGSNRRNAT